MGEVIRANRNFISPSILWSYYSLSVCNGKKKIAGLHRNSWYFSGLYDGIRFSLISFLFLNLNWKLQSFSLPMSTILDVLTKKMSHKLLGSLQSKQGHLEMPNECRRHVDQVMLPT